MPRNGRGSREVPDPFVPGHALGTVAPEADLECSRSEEDETSFARRQSPLAWKLVAYGGCFFF